MDLYNHFKQDSKSPLIGLLYNSMPRYLASKHRVHRLFFKKCNEPIEAYQNCIEDPKWKSNIDKYISDSLRRKCYNEWVQVRRCAVKNMGDSFSQKINISRQLEDDTSSEENMIGYYRSYQTNKERLLKTEKYIGAPPEEEAAEEAEEEVAEEVAEEEVSQEEVAQEEKTAEGEAITESSNQENSGENTQEEEA